LEKLQLYVESRNSVQNLERMSENSNFVPRVLFKTASAAMKVIWVITYLWCLQQCSRQAFHLPRCADILC